LEAYARLPLELRNRLSLVIAGGQGWRMPDLKKEIERRSIENTVILTEYVSDDVLAQLYKKAKFLVMPSQYEGFGLPIIEAQSFGTPVITSNRSSMPEVVGNGGILVDPDDIKSMSDALTHLANDELLYEKLALNARQNALRFDWQKSGEDLVAVFRQAIRDYYRS
jgi:glycosyltransferase involved in cell wall biosynthesis